jgi:O-succinylhomoserine sulfhydrylase
MSDDYQLDTLAVRAGIERSQFGEHSEPLYLTSSFVFKSAAQAAARFGNQEPGNIYSRFTNPTVTVFEKRLAALEGAEVCISTSSGMAAILSCVMGLLKAGDHVLCSASVFGATVQLFGTIMKRFGIDTTFVPGTDPAKWQAAATPNTRLLFIETPSNPLTEVYDIGAFSELAKKAGALLVVDNCFCSPALQQPLKLGADVVIHSATKYLDGQGRVLGGAVLGKKDVIYEGVLGFLRTAGPTLSAFNAWVILKGLETLSLRVQAHSAAALQLAKWLEEQPAIERVYYPGLTSHPQHALAMKQQKTGGGIVSFDVKGGRDAAWRVVDSTKLLSITANLGTPEARAAAGIGEGLLRVAVGLENIEDIKSDLARGLR